MLALLRQPLIKSVEIAQFGAKNFARPFPRVLGKSNGEKSGLYKYYHSRTKKTNQKSLIQKALTVGYYMGLGTISFISFLFTLKTFEDAKQKCSSCNRKLY